MGSVFLQETSHLTTPWPIRVEELEVDEQRVQECEYFIVHRRQFYRARYRRDHPGATTAEVSVAVNTLVEMRVTDHPQPT